MRSSVADLIAYLKKASSARASAGRDGAAAHSSRI